MAPPKNITRKDLFLIFAIVSASVTGLWASIKFVDDRFTAHSRRPHPGALGRAEYDLIMERLRTIETLIRKG